MRWTPERIARMRAMADSGSSMSEVGRKLGCTRNAIAGAAYRYDVPFECSPRHRADLTAAGSRRGWAKDDGTRRSAAAEVARRTFLIHRRKLAGGVA